MKKILTTLITILSAVVSFGQHPISGDYDIGLRLSYDSATKKVTGYFEDYTGMDETTHNPRFSCIFYIEGTATGRKFAVTTYCQRPRQLCTRKKKSLDTDQVRDCGKGIFLQ